MKEEAEPVCVVTIYPYGNANFEWYSNPDEALKRAKEKSKTKEFFVVEQQTRLLLPNAVLVVQGNKILKKILRKEG